MALQTVPNFGLFEGIANGVNQGLLTYQNQKNIQHQRKMEGLMNGIQTDEQGNPQGLMPWKQAQQQAETAKNNAMTAQYTPDSPYMQANAAEQATKLRENTPGGDLTKSISDEYARQGIKLDPSDMNFNEIYKVGEGLATAKLKGEIARGNKTMVTPQQWGKMGDDIDPTKARQGTLAKAQELLNATKRLDTFMQQFPNGNIPHGQEAEIANAAAAIVGGGSAQSQHQIDSIVPRSFKGDINGWISYLSNQPVGAEHQDFIKVMKESSDREKAYAQQLIHEGVGEKLGKYENLYDADPDHFARLAQDRGILPAEIGPHGHFKPQQLAPAAGLMQQAPAGQQAPPPSTDYLIGEKRIYQGKTLHFTGGDWKDPKSWKEVQ